MMKKNGVLTFRLIVASIAVTSCAAVHAERLSSDPFVAPIEAVADAVTVDFVDFAQIPAASDGEAPRMMHMLVEPATKRLFVSAMRGPLYSVSYDGKTVRQYIDVNDPQWAVGVQSQGFERGLQSFAFHPQFAQRGKRGYGKFYTYSDTTSGAMQADFAAPGAKRVHDMILLEWTAKNPRNAIYDGPPPREVFRVAHPYANHNGGQIAFNPTATDRSADFGLLYVGSADGGNAGDPMNLAQDLSSAFGKILRIDPLGTNARNGRYGVPSSNPFADDGKDETLGEIYARGLRNPQRFTWDSRDGRMLVADIGQNVVEEISVVTAGGNLGWNKWEGSYRYVQRQVDLDDPRSEPGMVWPLVEFDHKDPVFQRGVAITGLSVYRGSAIPQLRNTLIFGDIPSGEIFYVSADIASQVGSASIRRVLLNDNGVPKNLLQVISDRALSMGKPVPQRVDLRFGFGPRGEVFLLNKRDGVIRMLVPAGAKRARL